jgi:drug/metabolite transporter (DMT)-like permease
MRATTNISFIIALARIDVSTVLILTALAPFFAALLGWLVHKERTDVHTWVSMVGAVAGVVIMGSGWQATDLVGLACAITIAPLLGAYTVVLRGKGEASPEPRFLVLLNAIFGIVVTVPVIVATAPDGAASLIISPFDALCALTAGAVCLGVGVTLYNIAGGHIPAARSTLLMLSEVRF